MIDWGRRPFGKPSESTKLIGIPSPNIAEGPRVEKAETAYRTKIVRPLLLRAIAQTRELETTLAALKEAEDGSPLEVRNRSRRALIEALEREVGIGGREQPQHKAENQPSNATQVSFEEGEKLIEARLAFARPKVMRTLLLYLRVILKVDADRIVVRRGRPRDLEAVATAKGLRAAGLSNHEVSIVLTSEGVEGVERDALDPSAEARTDRQKKRLRRAAEGALQRGGTKIARR